MTIASIVLIVVLTFLLLSKKHDKITTYLVLLVFFELYANAGLLVEIGSVDILNSDLLWMILLTLGVHHSVFVQQNKKEFILLCILFLGIICNILFESFTTINIRSILVGIRFLGAVIILNFIFSREREGSIIPELSKRIVTTQIIYFSILAIEFIVKNFLHITTWNEAVSIVFGKSLHQVTWNVQRAGMASLQGLCKEPSHLAIGLFISGLLDLLIEEIDCRAKKLFWISIGILLISGSLSSILYISCLLLAYVLKTNVSVGKMIAVIVVASVFLVLYLFGDRIPLIEYYFKRIFNIGFYMNNNISMYTSEGQRLNSIIQSLSDFGNNLIFGTGLGSNVRTGAIPSLLAAGGCIVFVPYASAILKKQCFKSKTKGVLWIMMVASIFAMDMGILHSVSLGLIIMYTVYWGGGGNT